MSKTATHSTGSCATRCKRHAWPDSPSSARKTTASARVRLPGSVTLAGQSGNGGAVQSDTITNTLTTLIENGTLPSPDDNQLAMVYTPPGVGVIDANHYACNLVAACPPNETCDYFCGYTSAFPLGNQTAHYAVVSTASEKSTPSACMTKQIASPCAPQPKQWKASS